MEKRLRIIDYIFITVIVVAVVAVFYNVSTIKQPEQVMKNIETFLAIVISGGSIVWTVWKYYLLPRRKKIEAQESLIKSLADYLPLLKSINEQFHSNGGKSLKDGQIRIEYELKKLSQEHRAFFDVMDMAYSLSDETGLCVYASKSFCEILGHSPEEIVGNNWATWLHPKDKRIFSIWLDSVKFQMIFDEKYTVRRNDDLWQDVEGVSSHMNVNGRYVGSVGRIIKIGQPYKE